MALRVLTELRDAIIADAALNAPFIQRYQKPLGHLIGYDKGSPNADDRPLLCHVPVQRRYSKKNRSLTGVASVVIQIIEPETTDGVKDGVLLIETIVDQLVLFLSGYSTPHFELHSDFDVVTDLGARHPFYETEISFKFTYGMKKP